MHKLVPVEDAKTLFNEAKDWSVWRWLTEKKHARTTADAAWEALETCEEKVKAAWAAHPRYRRILPNGGLSQIAEQRPEAFLLKMPVVGENFGQPFLAHRLHRNAVCQAVAFVGPRSVESHAGEKRSPALRNDTDASVIENMLGVCKDLRTLRRIGSGAVAKKVRYSTKTSSVVTRGESARADVRAKARRWALSLKSASAIQ
jgi:hypothetical protein